MGISIERLIDNVKKHNVLFDKSHLDYKNVRVRNKLWNGIAKEMKLGISGGEELKKRWKGLRDCYAKYLRAQNSRTERVTKTIARYRTWPWARQMEIFKPFFNSTTTESDINYSENTHPSVAFIDKNQSLDEMMSEETESVENTSQQSKRISTSPTINVQGKNQESGKNPRFASLDEVIEFLKEDHNISRRSRDEIDLVFQGYAASVKKLSQRRQTLVKFKVAQIIMEAEIEQQEDNARKGRSRACIAQSFPAYLRVQPEDDKSAAMPENNPN